MSETPEEPTFTTNSVPLLADWYEMNVPDVVPYSFAPEPCIICGAVYGSCTDYEMFRNN